MEGGGECGGIKSQKEQERLNKDQLKICQYLQKAARIIEEVKKDLHLHFNNRLHFI